MVVSNGIMIHRHSFIKRRLISIIIYVYRISLSVQSSANGRTLNHVVSKLFAHLHEISVTLCLSALCSCPFVKILFSLFFNDRLHRALCFRQNFIAALRLPFVHIKSPFSFIFLFIGYQFIQLYFF